LPGEIRLQWWREALAGEREGEAAAHPVAAALGETIERYGLGSERLIALIDARVFDLYDEPMASATELEIYGIKTQSALFAMAGEILGGRGAAAETVTLDAGIAYAVGGMLQGFFRHSARRQLFVPLDLLNRHQVDRNEIYAGQVDEPLRAVLGELRALVRRHMATAQAKLKAAPAEILSALLPVALVGPALRRMERPGYQPFTFEPAQPWRRQWQLWRAARNPNRIFRA